MIHRIWRALKRQRRLRLGQATLSIQFFRTPPLRPARLPKAKFGEGNLHRPEIRAAQNPPAEPISQPEVALLVGVGPGLGEALARTLAAAGFALGLVARDGTRLEAFAERLRMNGAVCKSYVCDVTHEASVDALFRSFQAEFGRPDLVVYGLQSFGPGTTAEIEVPAFEDGWRHNCFGSFLVSRKATKLMAEKGRGTLALIGSTSAVLGREGHLNLAVGKFGQRALAQVLSREVWSKGVHVVHVVIDADIREEIEEPFPQSDPNDLASTVLFLHRQPRSAWTSEIDLRPWNEKFWEHC